jgi:hypothetical protein
MDHGPSITTVTTNKPKGGRGSSSSGGGGGGNAKKRGRETTAAGSDDNAGAKRPCAMLAGDGTTNYAESYVELASSFLFDKLTRRLGNYHQLPLEHMSALAYLQSPVRKPHIMETWNPYEIACFEAGLAVHGKDFGILAKTILRTKTTKQIIDFYYLWKKTSHYQKWKKEFVPAEFFCVVDSHHTSPATTSTKSTAAAAGSAAAVADHESSTNDDDHYQDANEEEQGEENAAVVAMETTAIYKSSEDDTNDDAKGDDDKMDTTTTTGATSTATEL